MNQLKRLDELLATLAAMQGAERLTAPVMGPGPDSPRSESTRHRRHSDYDLADAAAMSAAAVALMDASPDKPALVRPPIGSGAGVASFTHDPASSAAHAVADPPTPPPAVDAIPTAAAGGAGSTILDACRKQMRRSRHE